MSPSFNTPNPAVKNQSFVSGIYCEPNTGRESGQGDLINEPFQLIALSNPPSAQLYVELIVAIESFTGTLKVDDLFGQIVLSLNIDGFMSSLNISVLQNGTYIVIVESPDDINRSTVIVQIN